jgi:hypothetical protein
VLLLSDKNLQAFRQVKVEFSKPVAQANIFSKLHLVAWSDAKKAALQRFSSEEGLEAEIQKRKTAVRRLTQAQHPCLI